MGGTHFRSQSRGRFWRELLGAFALAALFLLPRLASPPAYPLHDVGFNLHVLENLDRASSPAAWLEEASRLRPERFYPLYWGYQHLLWRLGGRSLALFFPANILLLGLLLMGAGRLAARLGGPPWLAWIFLLASPGLVENVHTIMKQELPLACLEVWAWWALLSRKGVSALVLLLLAGLMKETALFAAPAFFLVFAFHLFSRPRKTDLLFLAAGGAALGLGILALLARRPGPYTQAFSLSPEGMARTFLFYLKREGPLFLFLPGAILLWGGNLRRSPVERKEILLGTTLLFLFWSGGYLPWQLPQVRYLLPAFAFLAPLSAAAWGQRRGAGLPGRTGAALFLAGVAVSLPWAAYRAFREGRARLAADQAVSRALEFAGSLPRRSALYLLLPEDEPLLEFRFRLSLQEGRPDISVHPALEGKKPAQWVGGLVKLAKNPPAGNPLLVPFAKGLPSFADRVFPVSSEWSAALEQAVGKILGFVTRPQKTLGTVLEDFQVGFRALRFQGPPKLELIPPGGKVVKKDSPLLVEGCLPASMEKAPLLLTLELEAPSPPPLLTWNGKAYPLEKKGPGIFQRLLPKDRPGPADAYHRFLGSRALVLRSPGRSVPVSRLTLECK